MMKAKVLLELEGTFDEIAQTLAKLGPSKTTVTPVEALTTPTKEFSPKNGGRNVKKINLEEVDKLSEEMEASGEFNELDEMEEKIHNKKKVVGAELATDTSDTSEYDENFTPPSRPIPPSKFKKTRIRGAEEIQMLKDFQGYFPKKGLRRSSEEKAKLEKAEKIFRSYILAEDYDTVHKWLGHMDRML